MRFERVDQICRWRLCSGCGACVSACPERNLSMADIPAEGLRPILKDVHCRRCGRCVQVCPGVGLEHNRENALIFSGEWGPVLEVWEGYAADPEIRYWGSSGGAASAFALYCVEQASAGGVVQTGVDETVPIRNRTCCSRTREEILRCSGSRYSPASPCEFFERILEFSEPSVFVGKPCDVAALRKYEKIVPEISKKIFAAVSIFCAGTPSTEGTLVVLREMGISAEKLSSFRYRGGGWPGKATAIEKKTGQKKELTYEQCWGGILSRYVGFRCRLCPDSTGEFADISFGDPWYQPPKPNEPGRSLVIVRTERGRTLLRQAVQKGYLILQPVSETVIARSQPSLLNKRRHLWGRLAVLRMMGVPSPRYGGFGLFRSWWKLPFSEKLKSLGGTVRRVWSRRLYCPLPSDIFREKSC
ncbi:MAG TPA: Coenzyme F420 hydrogenase/dehydrogenase, beta subunit C-terminal domain [Anaerohalosphaeraceae bacterium]|nr:Coenzyme F420 hydrogenase/dehydrogenase, beta subunit C-terminal domain [Anaerohalosphaeraceae bacterium]